MQRPRARAIPPLIADSLSFRIPDRLLAAQQRWHRHNWRVRDGRDARDRFVNASWRSLTCHAHQW
jgi:hypothetical protein